jgi:hypothetical protein
MNKNIIFILLLCLLPSVYVSGKGSTGLKLLEEGSEVVYIHTDRDIYIAGENMFFKFSLNTAKFEKNGKSSGIGYIILRNEKQQVLHLLVRLNAGMAFGSVYFPDTLQTGMYEIVGYTNFMRNFSEDFYFHKEILVINRFDKTLDYLYFRDSVLNSIKPGTQSNQIQTGQNEQDLTLVLEKDSFKIRERLKLGLHWTSKDHKQKILQASVSVKMLSPYVSNTSSGGQLIEDRGTDSSVIFNKNAFLKELNEVNLKGSITSEGMPLKGECLFISGFDTTANLQYTFSDDQGKFEFLLENYYLEKELVICPWSQELHPQRSQISIEDKFELHKPFNPHLPQMNAQLRKYIINSQDLVQVNKMYRKGSKLLTKAVNAGDYIFIPAVYYQVGKVIYPSNFVPLDDFQEITSNLMDGVVLKKNKNIHYLYLYDRLTKLMFSNPAVLFLDGCYIENAEPLMKLSSDDIEMIEISNNLRMKGILEFPGVLSVTTKKKKQNLSSMNSSSLPFRIEGYSEKAYYNAPVYGPQAVSAHMPDFRQLLYWNPAIEIKTGESKQFEFNCSDYYGEYLIEVNAVSEDGNRIYRSTKIKVYR